MRSTSASTSTSIESRPAAKNLDHVKAWGDPRVDGFSYFRHGTILRAFTTAAGIPALSGAPQLHVSPEVVRAVDAIGLPARYAVVHTTSNDQTKDWSPDAWREVVRYIVDSWQLPVVEVGLTATIDWRDERFLSLCGRISIMETAEVIRRSAFFVGVDSAGAHMANVWRIPSLLLFGEYKGENGWIPYEGFFGEEPERWILRHAGPLRGQSVATVIERLAQPGGGRRRAARDHAGAAGGFVTAPLSQGRRYIGLRSRHASPSGAGTKAAGRCPDLTHLP